MLKLDKEVRIGYGKARGRGNVSVLREHYLRDDIPCKSEGCAPCSQLGSTGQQLLSSSASHYALPDVSTLRDYLEVIEHPSITGVILPQTAIAHLRSKVGRQSYSRAVRLLESQGKQSVVFSNEHHIETFIGRREGESVGEWQERLVFRCGVWYSNHLQASGKTIPIVIITQHPEVGRQYPPYAQHYSNYDSGNTEGLLVMTVVDYLACFWSELSDVIALEESLTTSLVLGRQEGEGADYREYLSEGLILEGLRKGELLAGSLRVSRFHSRDEAFLTPHSTSHHTLRGDVLIYGAKNRNRAIHDDKVVVRVLPRSEWRGGSTALPSSQSGGEGEAMVTGVVVGIIQRTSREYVATFAETSENVRGRTEKVLVYPYDIRIPKVRISTRQAEQLCRHRIVVRIDSWEMDSQYPNGHFVRSIGPIGDLETETAVLLIEHGLSSAPFSMGVTEELPRDTSVCPWVMDPEEVSKRRDLRQSHLIFSIDPQGCEDVDDTLSVRHLKRGVTELGVHIADVSYFVHPSGLTDCEARARSTTVYLADRRYDMLPPILSANLCSLLSNVDRYAVSVIWKLDSNYEVKSVWYGRTAIRSAYQLAYETAQSLYDGASVDDVVGEIPELSRQQLPGEQLKAKVEELRGAVRSLVDIARVLRDRRAQGGALELESVEVRVQISDKDKTEIEDLIPRQPLEMHETVAECMIFANHWVAKKIHEASPTSALLRHHPPPSQDKFGALLECARAKGFTVATGSNKSLAESLDRCVDPHDANINKILRTLATQAMTQAEYFSTGSLLPEHFFHYGLALDLYTHFTSPIRRYADLVVHRQLLAAVGEGGKEHLPTNTQLTEFAHHMNTKHRAAQIAQLASTELFQCLYFASREGESVATGLVYSLRNNGVFVFVPRYGIRGPVYLRDKNGLVAQPGGDTQEGVVFGQGSLENSDNCITVTYALGHYSLKLFDHVRVRVCVERSHAHANSIVLQLLNCHPVAADTDKSTTKKELVKVVTAVSADLKQPQSPYSSTSAYRQSEPNQSLYCLMQDVYRLSLSNDV